MMLTMHNGASCLSVARQENHGEVCRLLEMACQNAGLSSHEITILNEPQSGDDEDEDEKKRTWRARMIRRRGGEDDDEEDA